MLVKKIIENANFKAIFVFLLITVFASYGFVQVFGYGGGGGSFYQSTRSSTITAINVPLDISSVQQGTLNKTFKNNGSQVSLNVLKGSVEGKTTFDLTLGAINHNINLINAQGAQVAGNNIYSLSAKNIEDDSLDAFLRDVTVKIVSDSIVNTTASIGVYYYDKSLGAWKKIEDALFDFVTQSVTFKTKQITDYAIFLSNSSSINTSGDVVNVLGDYKENFDIEGVSKNESKEVSSKNGFVTMNQTSSQAYNKLTLNNVLEEDKQSVAFFIHNGTLSTFSIGAGERAGVVDSYFSAFGSIPKTESEWSDTIKIANGRWPSRRNEARELEKSQEFEKIYLRKPDMENPQDNAAITIMTYGLRPAHRNLNSEKVSLGYFKNIYGHNPENAQDWDVVRAISYSGAIR